MKMYIDKKYIDHYDDSLVKLQSASENSFKNLVTASRRPNMTKKQLKKVIYQAAKDTLYSYSDAAGQLSCAFYENNATGPVETEIPHLPGYIRKRIHEHIETYALTHDLGDDEFMRLLAEDVGCEVVQHANRTTKHNAVKNGIRYARVPFGNSCAFCLMLASRGFVYETKTTAGEDKGHYHAHCRCKIVAGKKGTEIKGYDPDGLNKRMQQVAQELGISDFSWYRYQGNSAIQAALQREIRLRDKDWLLHDKPLEVDYENKLAEKNARTHEVAQAKRLSQHGIKCVFQVDYEVDEKTKGTARQKTIGKTDLADGIELKSLSGTSNLEKRIKKDLHNSKRKIGFKSCNFDATDSLFTDEEISEALRKQLKARHVNRASFIGKDGEYHVIYNEA